MGSTVHITEAEAARDFAAVMRHVRGGDEVILENAAGQKAVLKSADEKHDVNGSSRKIRGRTVAETVKRLHAWEMAHGVVQLDGEFADDLEEIHREYNRPLEDRWG
jgi:hypothetical protein